jgi:hypothetical protein
MSAASRKRLGRIVILRCESLIMATVIHEEIRSYPLAHCTINWGAIIAGLIFMFALSWLLFTLGSAIGLTVSGLPDPNRTQPDEMTFSLSPFVWVFLSTLLAFFLGGMIAGRLAGKSDRIGGMLHGITVWASAVILTLILGSFGIGGVTFSSINAAKTNEWMPGGEMQRREVPPVDSIPFVEGMNGIILLTKNEKSTAVFANESENSRVLTEYAVGTQWLVFVSNAAALVLAVLGSTIGAASVARMYLRNRF